MNKDSKILFLLYLQVGTAAAFCLLIGRTPVVAAQAELTGDDLDVNHLKDQDDQAEKKSKRTSIKPHILTIRLHLRRRN